MIKKYIITTWTKYAKRHGIKFYDFAILDNHAHALIKARSAKSLGNFMRTTNSLIARKVNFVLKRDSHALRERYKSPMITTEEYLINTIGYIWFNIYRATKIDPRNYPYCSLYFRISGEPLSLLSSYKDLGIVKSENEIEFVEDHFQKLFKEEQGLKSQHSFDDAVYEHTHTIGTESTKAARETYFRECLKKMDRAPP